MEFKNIASFDPRTCISRKVRILNLLTANVFRKHLKPFEITSSQVSILFVLSKREGLNQKTLTQITYLEKSSLNRNLKRLFEKGYLTKENFPTIHITQKGKIFVESIIPEWEKAMAEIRDILDEDGEESLNNLLNKLTT